MKLVYGFGINDVKGDSTKKSVYSKVYYTWKDMIKRCYSEKYQETHKTYIGVIICDEWKTYSKFKEWYISNYKDGYELDKDLIDGNKKMYSPETCSFVPNEINMCIIDKNNKNQPLGVCYHIPKKI